jgi:hypothetical protein
VPSSRPSKVSIPTACRVWKGAGELYERALAIGEAALGSDHPTVATIRGNPRQRAWALQEAAPGEDPSQAF